MIWVRNRASARKNAEGKVTLLVGTTQEITARKNVSEALRRSEERLALALEGADLGTWDWDIVSNQVTFDRRWAKMLGYDPSELTLTPSELARNVHPDDAARVKEEIRRHLRGETSHYEAEYRLRHKDGHYICVFDKGRVIQRDAEGNPARACGTHLNITGRRQAEQAKHDESIRRRALLEQSKDGIVILDESGKVIEANQSFADMLGYSPEEVLVLRVWDWDAQWSQENLASMMRFADGTGRQFETVFRRTDGRLLDVDISANSIDFDGEKLIFCVCRNISDRKRGEEELAFSNSLLRATLESTADGILVVNTEGEVATMNRRFKEMWLIPDHIAAGGDDRLLIGTVLEQLSDPEAFLDRVRQLYDHPLQDSFDVLQFKDGRVFERYSTPQRVGNRVAGRVWSFRDVSARVRIERERELLRDQYFQAQKMEAIGQLAGGVAHDFNNLLQIMLGYTECAKEEDNDPQQLKTSLTQVESAIQQARGLVGQLLTFSRRRPLNIERFELDGAVSRLAKMVSRLIGENIELVFKPGAPCCRIEADRVLIEQVILNLCVNARDAMNGGGTLTIVTSCSPAEPLTVEADDNRRFVKLSISDTGCGMDEETLKHIFEPFFTTKGVGKGTGLGLASAFGAIEQHNGSIEVHSRPGAGSRFDILLPLADIGETEEAVATRGSVEGGQETILLAEDDEVIRDLTHRILTRAGYTVIMAMDGEEAIDLFRVNAEKTDLLLLDLMMPRKGGYEVYLLAQEIRPGIPVIFASGFSKETVDLNLIESQGTALIQKPFRREKLLQTIREVLDLKSGGTDQRESIPSDNESSTIC